MISVPMHSDVFEAFSHLRKDPASLALNYGVELLSSRHHAVKPNHKNLYNYEYRESFLNLLMRIMNGRNTILE